MSTFNIVSETLRVYVKSLRANNNGILSKIEVAELVLIPMIAAALSLILTSGHLKENVISNLITVFGIFASVLITSFSPLIDFRGLTVGGEKSKAQLTESENEVNTAVEDSRNYLFAFNCMSLFLSLASICLLLIFPFVSQFGQISAAADSYSDLSLRYFGLYIFPLIVFWVMSAALLNVVKTLQVVIRLFG